MSLLGTCRQALGEAWSHKTRSTLTLSGIALGVAALVAMVGMIEALLRDFRIAAESRGTIRKIAVERGTIPPEQQHLAEYARGISLDDVRATERTVHTVTDLTPRVDGSWAPVQGARLGWGRVTGSAPGLARLYELPLREGRFLTQVDVDTKADVVVLGAWVADNIFPGGEPIVGRRVTVRGQSFRIIGVFDAPPRINPTAQTRGGSFFRYRGMGVVVPYTTALQRLGGRTEVDEFEMQAVSIDALEDALEQTENALLGLRRGLRDFQLETQVEDYEALRENERRMRIGLGGIAALSLFIGAVGVFSVVLASVNERVREIGVRKSVGARPSDILFQFLLESTILAVLGGLLGLGLSFAVLEILAGILPDQPPAVVPWAFAVGAGSSAAVGIIAGFIPALRAARLDPVEALRKE
jgi:ABC-type antimicrobial peptide transport system permease subunit